MTGKSSKSPAVYSFGGRGGCEAFVTNLSDSENFANYILRRTTFSTGNVTPKGPVGSGRSSPAGRVLLDVGPKPGFD